MSNLTTMRRSIFISIFFLQRQVQQQQQQQVLTEDLQQEAEILKGNSFTLPEFAFSKFDIKGHIKQIQIEHITKSQIMQEMAQFIKYFYFFSGGGISSNLLFGVPSYFSNPDPRPYFRPIFILTSWKD